MSKSNIPSSILKDIIRDILLILNVPGVKLVELLTKDYKRKEMFDEDHEQVKSIHTRNKQMVSSLDDYDKSLTFKTFIAILSALRIPKVVIRIDLYPNYPRKVITVKKTLNFEVKKLSNTDRLRMLSTKKKKK